MRALTALVTVAITCASAAADPPTLSYTGELEPRGVCAKFMDFHRTGGGSLADGKAERILLTTYDAKGRAIAERWWGFDTPVRLVDHTYDARGRRATTRWRVTSKRVVLTKRYRYNRRGKLLATITDYPNKERWKDDIKYDARGRVVRTRQSVNPRTGKVYAPTHTFRYKHGRVSVQLIDRDNSGKPNERVHYHYDARGRLAAKLMKPASDQYAEQLTDFLYDSRGRLVEKKTTHIWPKRPKWTGPRRVLSYRYDRAGNLLSVERRVTPGGTVGLRTTFDYACLLGGPLRAVPAEKCRSSYPTCGKP